MFYSQSKHSQSILTVYRLSVKLLENCLHYGTTMCITLSIEAPHPAIAGSISFSPLHPFPPLRFMFDFAPSSNLLTLIPEQYWKRNHRHGQEREQARRPINIEPAIHVAGKQRECGAKTKSDKAIRAYRAVRVQQIHIDQVSNGRDENSHGARADEESRQNVRHPAG